LTARAEEVLFKHPFQEVKAGEVVLQELYLIGWTPDGKYLIYRDPIEVSALALDGSRKTTHLLPATLATLGVDLSPDGRWLAYSSNEFNLSEIYVAPFHTVPDGTPNISGGKWQVSNGGGIAPVWRRDGKELFSTHSSASTLMSASVSIVGDHSQSDKPTLFSMSTRIRS
jgi:Tol biopolymer transport system component